MFEAFHNSACIYGLAHLGFESLILWIWLSCMFSNVFLHSAQKTVFNQGVMSTDFPGNFFTWIFVYCVGKVSKKLCGENIRQGPRESWSQVGMFSRKIADSFVRKTLSNIIGDYGNEWFWMLFQIHSEVKSITTSPKSLGPLHIFLDLLSHICKKSLGGNLRQKVCAVLTITSCAGWEQLATLYSCFLFLQVHVVHLIYMCLQTAVDSLPSRKSITSRKP